MAQDFIKTLYVGFSFNMLEQLWELVGGGERNVEQQQATDKHWERLERSP